jgi:hypothetical protein
VSPDGSWIATNTSKSCTFWRVPEGRPLQTLPREEFLERLKELTNLRVVADKVSSTGYRIDRDPFPGWEKPPAWKRLVQ